MHKIAITTECVADLPQDIRNKYDIGIIYYNIETERGLFRDNDEVTATNIMEYMIGGKKKAQSVVPSTEEYKAFFEEKLSKYDEVIHLNISTGISEANENASLAKDQMGNDGDKVHLIDSRHLSSGQGLLVIMAAKLRNDGLCSDEIISQISKLIPSVSTSFLSYNADYLYYNGKVSKTVMEICQKFSLHPVLMMLDGKLTLSRVYIGKYEKCAMRYIKRLAKKSGKIDKKTGFITYAGCGHETLKRVHDEVDKRFGFDDVFEQSASATVSCNCGPNTFGVLFFTEEK